jgi:hypothetical protein
LNIGLETTVVKQQLAEAFPRTDNPVHPAHIAQSEEFRLDWRQFQLIIGTCDPQSLN